MLCLTYISFHTLGRNPCDKVSGVREDTEQEEGASKQLTHDGQGMLEPWKRASLGKHSSIPRMHK